MRKRREKGNIANELPQVVVREDGRDDGDDDADDVDDEEEDGLRPLLTAWSGCWGEIVRVERIFSTVDEEDWPA